MDLSNVKHTYYRFCT